MQPYEPADGCTSNCIMGKSCTTLGLTMSGATLVVINVNCEKHKSIYFNKARVKPLQNITNNLKVTPR